MSSNRFVPMAQDHPGYSTPMSVSHLQEVYTKNWERGYEIGLLGSQRNYFRRLANQLATWKDQNMSDTITLSQYEEVAHKANRHRVGGVWSDDDEHFGQIEADLKREDANERRRAQRAASKLAA